MNQVTKVETLVITSFFILLRNFKFRELRILDPHHIGHISLERGAIHAFAIVLELSSFSLLCRLHFNQSLLSKLSGEAYHSTDLTKFTEDSVKHVCCDWILDISNGHQKHPPGGLLLLVYSIFFNVLPSRVR